jgi:hypothetical protein
MGVSCVKQFFVNILGEELPTRWKFGMMALANSISRVPGHSLWMITTSSKVSSCFDFHIGTSKFDVKIFDGTQFQKEYEAEVHFH